MDFTFTLVARREVDSIGTTVKLRYAGHIGYEVLKEYRGHRYAARSCRLILPLASAHGLKAVWLTVDPKNIPSQKTCGIIRAAYVETVRIPKEQEMYQQGARYRRRYRLDLNEGLSNTSMRKTTTDANSRGKEV